MSEIDFSEGGSTAPERKRSVLSDRALVSVLFTALALRQSAWFAAIGYGVCWLIGS